ncbi:ABC transporter ATP-binding protein [Synergistales bacterium]|nr:ABC transporter ATP-binding protein [Synergistales bacterium]
MLKVTDLCAGYGPINVLWGIELEVNEGEVVSILGGNGAGKTTIVRALSGLIRPRKGSIKFNDKELVGQNNVKFLEAGIVQIPEGRQLFVDMTVFENLELGAFSDEAKAQMNENLKFIYQCFPKVKERQHQLAGTLSGGEQQMVAVSRGILSMPKLIIFDEPSLGLAPNVVDQILDVAKSLAKDRGLSVILVEQDVHKALRVSDRGYVVENGLIVLEDTAANLMNNENVKKAYLGF